MTAWLSKYLEYKLPSTLRRKIPGLYLADGSYVPSIGDLPVGAKTITQEKIDHYGQAAIMAGRAQDIPLTEVTISEERHTVIAVIGGCSYNDPELQAAQFAASNGQITTDLSGERLFAMRRTIEVKIHGIVAFGAPRYEISGFLNHPDVPIDEPTFKPYVLANIGDATIYFIKDQVTDMRISTNLVEAPNIILVSPKMYAHLYSRFRTNTSEMTLADAIMRTNPSIQSIVEMRELSSANLIAAGVHEPVDLNNPARERMVIYNLNSENLYRRFSPMRMMPTQQEGLNYNIYAYQCMSGVKWQYPLSAKYVDYAIATT